MDRRSYQSMVDVTDFLAGAISEAGVNRFGQLTGSTERKANRILYTITIVVKTKRIITRTSVNDFVIPSITMA